MLSGIELIFGAEMSLEDGSHCFVWKAWNDFPTVQREQVLRFLELAKESKERGILTTLFSVFSLCLRAFASPR